MSKTMQVLIVEDEPIIADDIAICMDQMGHEVTDICDTADQALAALNQHTIDLVLLDIKIKGDRDGVQLAQCIKQKTNIPFIYISSLYDKTTISRVKNTHPSGYIIKPFKDEDIKVAVDMALVKTNMKPVNESDTGQIELFIREKNSIVPLDLNEVFYIEASDNYSIFHFEGKHHVVSQTLKLIEQTLTSQGYCRIHKTFLVNLRKIDRIEHSVVFINGRPLPIGKAYKKSFIGRLTIF